MSFYFCLYVFRLGEVLSGFMWISFRWFFYVRYILWVYFGWRGVVFEGFRIMFRKTREDDFVFIFFFVYLWG